MGEHNTSTQKHVLTLILILIMVSAPIATHQVFANSMETQTGKYSIPLASKTLNPKPGLDLDMEQISDYTHLIVQLHPNKALEAEKHLSEHHGVEVFDGPINQAWIIGANKKQIEKLAKDPNIRWISAIKPEYKLSPLFNDPQLRWLHKELVPILIIPFKDANLEKLVSELVRTGCLITDASKELIHTKTSWNNLRLIANLEEVMWVEPEYPIILHLNTSRKLVKADKVQEPPNNILGTGVNVLIMDAGRVYPHTDLKNIIIGDNSSVSGHATHVAGIVAGDGERSQGKYVGMAPASTIITYDFAGNIISEYVEGANLHNADITNNSWGLLGNHGLYLTYSYYFDQLTRGEVNNQQKPLVMVVSAGNSGASGYWTITVPATSKNAISVGSTNDYNDTISYFSSKGPTMDGRLKPDLVAPGSIITSTWTNNWYVSLSGTSMSGPHVAGVAALLIEAWRKNHLGPSPSNATLKGVLIHTAVDKGYPGPDYIHGWGRIDAEKAFKLVKADRVSHLVRLGSLAEHGDQDEYEYHIPPKAEKLKVTLVWDDPPGSIYGSQTTKKLVNDLDLLLKGPDDKYYYPWKLNPNKPYLGAVTNKSTTKNKSYEDNINNVEQVLVEKPEEGDWKVFVEADSSITKGPQKYTLIFEPIVGLTLKLLSDRKQTIKPGGEDGPAEFEFEVINSNARTETIEFETNVSEGWTTSFKYRDGTPLLDRDNNKKPEITLRPSNMFAKYPDKIINLEEQPVNVFTADLNGDSREDLIIPAKNSKKLILLYQNDDGDFVAKTVTTEASPNWVVAKDLNNDKHIDIVNTNMGSNTITIFYGRATGLPNRPSKILNTNSKPTALIVEDLNNDNRLDIANLNTDSNTITIFYQTETGFNPIPSKTLKTGSGPSRLVAVDLDGDNRLDLVNTNMGSNTITIFYNSEQGFSSTPSQVLATGIYPTGLVVMDLNQDNKLDIANVNTASKTIEIRYQGEDGFTTVDQTLEAGDLPTTLLAEDLDNDGWLELACLNQDDEELGIYKYDDTEEKFGEKPWVVLPTGKEPVGVATGTINPEDNYADIVFAGLDGPCLTIYNQSVQREKIILEITPPEDVGEGEFEWRVTARSTKDPEVKDEEKIEVKVENHEYAFEIFVDKEEQTIIPGGSAKYTITIVNTGIKEDTYELSFDPVSGWGITLSKDSVTLKPEKKAEVTLRVKPESGTKPRSVARVEITAKSQKKEGLSKTVETTTVLLANGVDLTVDELKIDPSSPTTNQTVSISAKMWNIGTRDAGKVVVIIVAKHGDSVRLVYRGLLELPSNTSKTVETSWRPRSKGTHTIIAVVDPTNRIREVNEDNNTIEETVEVG
ncbi:MAG: hypothetical protein DRO11_01440 [Methanobacteriota archaeon]|nr:MAG: hypothetical protein DRO11_01440 [Euryarchaeota archaeon]